MTIVIEISGMVKWPRVMVAIFSRYSQIKSIMSSQKVNSGKAATTVHFLLVREAANTITTGAIWIRCLVSVLLTMPTTIRAIHRPARQIANLDIR